MKKAWIIFFLSLILLSVLILYARSVAPTPKNIAELSASDIGDFVRVSGRISRVSQKENLLFMSICKLKCINIVLFSDFPKLRKGQIVSASGVVQQYSGKLEIVVSKETDIEVYSK